MSFSIKLMKLFLCLSLIFHVYAIEADLSVYINARETSCFYQQIEKGTVFEVEYQVIDGGDLDINFSVRTPSGRVMVAEYRKNEGNHKLDSIEGGDYRFCLDNGFSRFSEKLVYIDITTDSEDSNWPKLSELGIDYDYDTANSFEITIDEFKASFDTVQGHLDKSIKVQRSLRAKESQDRSRAEDNFIRVNFWAPLQLIVMVLVALSQVFFIRNLFGDSTSVKQKGIKVQT